MTFPTGLEIMEFLNNINGLNGLNGFCRKKITLLNLVADIEPNPGSWKSSTLTFCHFNGLTVHEF